MDRIGYFHRTLDFRGGGRGGAIEEGEGEGLSNECVWIL